MAQVACIKFGARIAILRELLMGSVVTIFASRELSFAQKSESICQYLLIISLGLTMSLPVYSEEVGIGQLQLKPRTVQSLYAFNINTLEDLCLRTKLELNKVMYIEPSEIERIAQVLKGRGCELVADVQPMGLEDIRNLRLSAEVEGILRQAGIRTTHQLTRYSGEQLKTLKDMGEVGIGEIELSIKPRSLAKDEDRDDQSKVASLDLSKLTRQSLKLNGIVTIEQLTRFTRSEILKWPRIGYKSVKEVEAALVLRGLKLFVKNPKTVQADPNDPNSIESLGLMARTVNVLAYYRIDKVDSLSQLSWQRLKTFAGLGAKGRTEIREALKGRGYALYDDELERALKEEKLTLELANPTNLFELDEILLAELFAHNILTVGDLRDFVNGSIDLKNSNYKKLKARVSSYQLGSCEKLLLAPSQL